MTEIAFFQAFGRDGDPHQPVKADQAGCIALSKIIVGRLKRLEYDRVEVTYLDLSKVIVRAKKCPECGSTWHGPVFHAE